MWIYQRHGDVYFNPDGGIYADYSTQIDLAHDTQALVDNIDLLLTGNRLSATTKNEIITILEEIPMPATSQEYARKSRVKLAISLVMTSVEFLVRN